MRFLKYSAFGVDTRYPYSRTANSSVGRLWAIDEGTGGYGETDFLVHSPDQVRVLLDV